MSRGRRRELLEGACFYHVTARGAGGGHVFLVDLDRLDFVHVLGLVANRFDLRLIARALMGTHYHLILEAHAAQLPPAMQQLNSVYARRFNTRHGRQGHLFGARYGSWVIRDETHLHAAVQYVIENPARAGLGSEADRWTWSVMESGSA